MSTPLVNRADWRHSAAWRCADRELFVLVGTRGPALVQIAAARAVCRRCPVESDRVRWALAHGLRYGGCGLPAVAVRSIDSASILARSTTRSSALHCWRGSVGIPL